MHPDSDCDELDTLQETHKFSWAGLFSWSGHENTMLFSSTSVTDENVVYFRGPVNIFVGRPTRIRKVFSSASGPTKMWCIFIGLSQPTKISH
jgi:hypothetical protein